MTRRRRIGMLELHRTRLRRALCGLLLSVSGATFGADATDTREYQIKAAFLYNFTRFVEWPASSFADAGSPIVIGAYCADPFGAVLKAIVKGRTVNGRGIVARKLDTVELATSAHVVFVCAAKDTEFAHIESVVDGRPVLTVGETDAFAEAAGIIRFVLDEEKVRFEINMAAAERAGLKVSAQLQKLATAVRRAP